MGRRPSRRCVLVAMQLLGSSEPSSGPTAAHRSYGVVFDLGSSGTRAYVFQWERRKSDGCAVLPSAHEELEAAAVGFRQLMPAERHTVEEDVPYKKQKPGVSSFAEIPEMAGQSLAGLFEFVEEWVPEEQRKETPVFLLATAGLRVLAAANGEKIYDDDEGDADAVLEEDDDNHGVGVVAAILGSVRQYVREETEFPLPNGSQARVLTGTEEGIFDFLSLQEVLHVTYGRALLAGGEEWEDLAMPHGAGRSSATGYFPIGTMDLGGASTQIAYSYSAGKKGGESERERAARSLFTHSFLDFGIVRAHDRYMEYIVAEGYKVDPCLPVGLRKEGGGDQQLSGGGDPRACLAAVKTLLATAPDGCQDTVEARHCAVSHMQLPTWERGTRFVAFDHAHRVAAFFGAAGFTQPISLHSMVERYLEASGHELLAEHQDYDEETLALLGFEGMYVYGLVTHGYGIDDYSNDIAFAASVGGVDLNWSLGAMTVEVNRLCLLGEA